jgi:hypothetical protein
MKKSLIITALIIVLSSCATKKEIISYTNSTDISYHEYFTGNTMRFDFHHAGNSKEEMYYFDKVIREGVWAGSEVSLINPFDYGEQMFRIIDSTTGNVI